MLNRNDNSILNNLKVVPGEVKAAKRNCNFTKPASSIEIPTERVLSLTTDIKAAINLPG